MVFEECHQVVGTREVRARGLKRGLQCRLSGGILLLSVLDLRKSDSEVGLPRKDLDGIGEDRRRLVPGSLLFEELRQPLARQSLPDAQRAEFDKVYASAFGKVRLIYGAGIALGIIFIVCALFVEKKPVASTVNRYGERNIDLVSGFAENVEIPETFVDYSDHPREYSLSAVQTVVRVHTRVSDLYNGPYDQLEEQMRLTVEGIKERQEWELINNSKFGLIHSADPAMRISTRYGAPTPDDLDELLALVWKKPAFFLAHPKAIAAFERECTWRGVPPVTADLFGTAVITWRGVPLVPWAKSEYVCQQPGMCRENAKSFAPSANVNSTE